MEQARFWMWAKTKPDPNPRALAPPPPAVLPYGGDSWEEQAFAEDAAGTLGGCVWPPRSYSCSFCRREFKSAQALGGHMNVHRRDRARLKQSSNSPAHDGGVVTQALTACTSFDAPYSSKLCTTFLYNNNPNPNPVSSPHHPSWSSFLSEKRDRDAESNVKKRGRVDPTEKEDCVTELDVSKSLSLVVVCNDQTKASSDEEVASCKRRKIEPKLSEELDLELRLGNAPKVK
ncbi:hypothetical protein ACS0TY_015684 [Phlomoides rotata]